MSDEVSAQALLLIVQRRRLIVETRKAQESPTGAVVSGNCPRHGQADYVGISKIEGGARLSLAVGSRSLA